MVTRVALRKGIPPCAPSIRSNKDWIERASRKEDAGIMYIL